MVINFVADAMFLLVLGLINRQNIIGYAKIESRLVAPTSLTLEMPCKTNKPGGKEEKVVWGIGHSYIVYVKSCS